MNARSSILSAATMLLLAAAILPAQDLPPVALETLATDLPALTSVTHAGDERLFLTTLDGRILVVSEAR